MKSPLRLLREGHPAAIALLLFVLAAGTFLPCLRYDFVNLDDNVYVYENARVAHGLTWPNIRWAITTLEGGFWHPLTWLSFLLDAQWSGLRAAGYHRTGLLLHAANTVLVFLLFRRLTAASWRSAFVAALFAVHPLHVEPVAWISSRKDVLSTLFWLLALLAYVHYAQGKDRAEGRTEGGVTASVQGSRPPGLIPKLPSFISYLLALCCFGCGLMSKAMVVTLPFILLLLDWWPLERLRLKTPGSRLKTLLPLLLEKLPFLAASFVCGLLTVSAEKDVGAMHTISDVPAPDRIANAILGCCRYLVQTVWPSGLAAFYPYPRAFSPWAALGAGVFLLLATALIWWSSSRRRPYLAFGWIWYGLTLLPVVGLIQVGSHSHADRYTYVPLIGVFFMMVWGAYDLTRRWPQQTAALSTAGAIVLLVLIPLARHQLAYWKDSETLFRHALAVTEHNHFAHNSLGLARLQKGQVDEAITQFNAALEAEPTYSRARNNLGIALLEKGRVDEAIADFQAALEHRPDFAEVSYNLGVALLRKGRPQDAIAPFEKAVASRPDVAKARYGLGSGLLRVGRNNEAIAQFRKTLALDPDYAEVHSDLGLALLREGQVDEAIAHFQRALQIRPDSAEACYNLGISLLRKGRPNEAIPPLQKAVVLQPGLTEVQAELAKALLRAGKVDDAIVHYQKAVQADPKLASAHSDLASALLQRGRAAEAIAHYQAAIDAQPGNAYLLNNLAWVLATSTETSIRNGVRALDLAKRADRLSGGTNPSIQGTLAAAYAETGRFPEAITTAQRALEFAVAQTNIPQAGSLRQQVQLYRAGSPLRESAQTNAPVGTDRSGASRQ